MRIPLICLALWGCTADSADNLRFDPSTDARLAADALWGHLQALDAIAATHDGHRALGSSGYQASVDYVTSTLVDIGLSPVTHAFDHTQWRQVSASLSVDGTPRSDEVAGLTHAVSGAVTGTPVAVDVQEPPGSLANSATSGCEAEDFADFPTGSIAVVQRGTCTFATKARLAQQAGATAVIVYNEGQDNRTSTVNGSLDPNGEVDIPVVGVSYATGRTIADANTVTLELVTEIVRTPSMSVVVDIAGATDAVWIAGGHLDSVPEGPGINDNGTGVALLLQLAEVFATEPTVDVGLRLAWWGGEEVGLLGSSAYVAGLTADQRAPIEGYLNFDMVGSPNAGRFIYDSDGSSFGNPSDLPEVVDNARIEAAFTTHFEQRGLATAPTPYDGRSDYLAFARAELATTGLFSGAETLMSVEDAELFDGLSRAPFDPCYHRACDGLDNVDGEIHEQMTRAAADVVQQLISTEAP